MTLLMNCQLNGIDYGNISCCSKPLNRITVLHTLYFPHRCFNSYKFTSSKTKENNNLNLDQET